MGIYKKKGICFGLGAGISVGSFIPSWEKLLQKVSYYKFKDDKIFTEFLKERYSYEGFASFLKLSSASRPALKPFTEIVREELYRDFKKAIDSSNKAEIIKHVNEKNCTLSSIGSFCACKESEKNTYTANPLVHGIINFNIDRLLRVYTAAKFNERILRTVERASAGRTPGKINVYHIHGMMRFDLEATPKNESPDKLVIAEDEYYQLFNNSTMFFNYSFLYLLREYSFLFIGLSMQDQNLRRLLFLSKNEISEGYKTEKLSENESKEKLESVNKHYAILKEPLNKEIKNFHEITLLGLGVNVIWVNSYDRIEHILKDIYSVSGTWDDVYESCH